MPTGQTVDQPIDDHSERIDTLEVECPSCSKQMELDGASFESSQPIELTYVCMACERYECISLKPDPDAGHDSQV